jgi:hypothetical protein
MDRQLHLLTNQPEAAWRLDPKTRAIGQRGLAQARAALQAARAAGSPTPTPLRPSSSTVRRRAA